MKAIVLDKQLQEIIDAVGGMSSIDLDSMVLEDALKIARPQIPTPAPPANCEDRKIPGSGGEALSVRIYYPPTKSPKLPMVLYFHGGGFVGGTVAMDDIRCSRLAQLAHCIVVSVDYRLAPEHPFPAAIEDGYAAWQWLQREGVEMGGEPEICAICGSSAGGHIAVGVTRLLRDHGGVMPVFQLLANPALDPAMAGASYREFEHGPFLTAARMAWYWKQYRTNPDSVDPPLWAPLSGDFAGFPPTHVMTAEYDVLRDEGEIYAESLRNAGIKATMERYTGMIHGFITMLPDHPMSVRAMTESAAVLQSAFDAARSD